MPKKPDDRYTDEEATRRINEALWRVPNTPPKPQKGNGGQDWQSS